MGQRPGLYQSVEIRGDNRAAYAAGSVADIIADGGRDAFVWFHAVNPTPEDAAAIAAQLGLHELAAEDIHEGRQPPKIVAFSNYLYFVAWDVLEHDPRAGIGETYLFLADTWLLTVQRGDVAELADLPSVLRHRRQGVPDTVLGNAYTILDDVVERYRETSARIEKTLEEVESQVFDGRVRENFRETYDLRQRIGRIDRAVSGLADALTRGNGALESLVAAEPQMGDYFADLYESVLSADKLTTEQHQALDAVVSSHQSNVASRQNKDMRTISAYAALLAIPTLIAGIYGMNFKNLPLVEWQFGWVAVAGAIVVLEVVVLMAFKRKKWL